MLLEITCSLIHSFSPASLCYFTGWSLLLKFGLLSKRSTKIVVTFLKYQILTTFWIVLNRPSA